MSVKIKESVMRRTQKNKTIRDKNNLKNKDRPEKKRGVSHG